MITRANAKSKSGSRGFTLSEVMIAATLGTMVMAGVMSTFLMLGRSGANISNYSMMETQSRRALEEFSQDLRMASNVTWNSNTSITLTVPNNYTTTSFQVTYAYDSSTSGATAQSFYRMPGDASATNPKTVLIRNVVAMSYARFNRLNGTATSNQTTKRIQLSMTARTTTRTVANASNIILSASYILRNKYAN